MESMEIANNRKLVLWRGVCLRCPRCGEGKLFASYLKRNDACPACGEDLTPYRADDGPAWLTILLTGHIVMPFAIYFSMHQVAPEWAELLGLFLLTMASIFALLPPSKGLFISALWLLAKRDPNKKGWFSLHF